MSDQKSGSPENKMISPEASDVEFRGDTQVVATPEVPIGFVPPSAALVQPSASADVSTDAASSSAESDGGS